MKIERFQLDVSCNRSPSLLYQQNFIFLHDPPPLSVTGYFSSPFYMSDVPSGYMYQKETFDFVGHSDSCLLKWKRIQKEMFRMPWENFYEMEEELMTLKLSQ